MDTLATLKNFLYALLGLGVVGGAMYMTGAGEFPSSTPQIIPFPVNQDLVEFYTAACDVQVLTNQSLSLNSVGYILSPVELTGDPALFTYTTMTQSSTDRSRWSAGALQGAPYWCYIQAIQNNPPPVYTSKYYANFTRSPNSNMVGDIIWSSGTYSGTYNYKSLTITGPITLSDNTNLNVLESITITAPNGQISITSGKTLNMSSYNILNSGTIIGTGSHILLTKAAYFTNTGTISLTGAAGSGAGGCVCTTSCGTPHCSNMGSPGGNGGAGGTFRAVNSNIRFNNTGTGSIILNGGAGGAASPPGCGWCASQCQYPSYTIIVQQPAGNGGTAGSLILGDTYTFVNSGVINAYAGAGGTGGYGGIYCGNGVAGLGTSNIINSSNITSIVGDMITSGTGGTWTINRCGNTTDDSKVVPSPTINALTCLLAPTTSFLTPNSTTSLLTLSNNLTINLSTSAPELAYRFQLSLDNGSTWKYITEATTITPAYFNRSKIIDVFLMAATPQAQMRTLVYNNTSNVFGDWTYSQSFYLLNRNTTLLNTTVPTSIVTVPFTVYCNYTSNDTPLQDAMVRVYVDGVSYDTTYDATTKLYSYNWPVNLSLVSGAHTYYCWANKGNFNFAQSAAITFNIGGFGVYYLGGNSTQFFCPFPTYIGVYPAYQTASKGVVRVQNFNASVNGNYSVILRYPQPSGMIVYGRCDKLSPSTSGWTILSDVSYYQCWNNINSTNITSYMWMKGDCVGATPGTYTAPELVIVEN